MTLTARELNRSTLDRQLLLKRTSIPAAEAIRRVVALQAQHPASPYIAMWNRIARFDPEDLDNSFAGFQVVKATLMRSTLHAVHTDDYRVFREAVEPALRKNSLNNRFTASGLTVADADALIPDVMTFARKAQTTDELVAWLGEWIGDPPHTGVLRAVRGYTPLLHAPTGGPWSFGRRASYVTPRPTPALADPEVADKALQTLVLRYLDGFGPASVADTAQFAGVQRGRVRTAINALAEKLERLEGPCGEELFDIPEAPRPNEGTPAPPRLMAMWDNVLLAYADRSRVIPPEYRNVVIRVNGDVLPTLLVDGYVAGVWRPVDGGIEATAFHRLTDDTWEDLAKEARSLLAFLADREADPYRRHQNWWRKLQGEEVRVLAGDD